MGQLGPGPGALPCLFPGDLGLVPVGSLLHPTFPVPPQCPVSWGHVQVHVGSTRLCLARCRQPSGALRGAHVDPSLGEASPAPQSCWLIASPTPQYLPVPVIALMEMAPSHPVVVATGKDAAEPAPASPLRLRGAALTLKYPPPPRAWIRGSHCISQPAGEGEHFCPRDWGGTILSSRPWLSPRPPGACRMGCLVAFVSLCRPPSSLAGCAYLRGKEQSRAGGTEEYQLVNYWQAACLAASIKPFTVALFWALRAPCHKQVTVVEQAEPRGAG